MQDPGILITVRSVTAVLLVASPGFPTLSPESTPDNVTLLGQTKAVRLVVEARTWREGHQPYDIGTAIAQRLAGVDFTLVAGDSDDYDATLFVNYTEEKDRWSYEPGGPGTHISCSLKFVHRESGKEFTEAMTGSSGAHYEGLAIDKDADPQEAVYNLAVRHFEDHPIMKYLGRFVQAHMGHGDRALVLLSAFAPGEDGVTQYHAAKLLGEAGDGRAIQPLLQALERGRGNEQNRVIKDALWKLGWRPTDAAKVIQFRLSTYAKGNRSAREITQLGAEAVPLLLAIARDWEKGRSIREKAVQALGALRDSRSVSLLIDALQQDDYLLRLGVVSALGQIGDPRAIPALTEVLKKDPRPGVKGAASRALRQIEAHKPVQWAHETKKDEMTGEAKREVFALNSNSTVRFGPPWGGPHKATLYLFVESDGSRHVMISIKGQILHGAGGRISFDGGPPQRLSLSERTPSKPTVAFLETDEDAVVAATEMEVELSFSHEGSRTITFRAIEPLSQHKKLLAYETEKGRRAIAEAASVACDADSDWLQRTIKAGVLLRMAEQHPRLMKAALTEQCVDQLQADGITDTSDSEKLRSYAGSAHP